METDFQYLENDAASHFKAFMSCWETVRQKFPLPDDQAWEWDDDNMKFRQIKSPEMEWLDFEEPNEELT